MYEDQVSVSSCRVYGLRHSRHGTVPALNQEFFNAILHQKSYFHQKNKQTKKYPVFSRKIGEPGRKKNVEGNTEQSTLQLPENTLQFLEEGQLNATLVTYFFGTSSLTSFHLLSFLQLHPTIFQQDIKTVW